MADMREFLLGDQLQVKLATDVDGAKTMVQDYINSDPALQQKYGKTYGDILKDDKKFAAWSRRVQMAYDTATVKQDVSKSIQDVSKRMIDSGATEVPAGDVMRQPMPQNLQPPQSATQPIGPNLVPPMEQGMDPNVQQQVVGGATKDIGTPVSPKQMQKNDEEMFKYLTTTGALNWNVPTDSATEMGNLLAGGIDPNSTPEQVKQQIEFHKEVQRGMFDPQVFFPAMGYVMFGNWPSLLTIMAAGGLGSVYQDLVNTGRLPNVLPPFDQPSLGGKQIGGALKEQVTPENWQQFVANAGENAALQGIWELFGIVSGGMLGGISTTRPGVLGREKIIQGFEDVIKYAEKLGIKFPGAYLSSEGYGRMIWDFSHATITSEPLYNKWVADLVEKIGKKATADLFSQFKTGLVENVSALMNPREIGKIVGDALGGTKVFSDLGENFMWRRLGELDRYGVKVDMSGAVGTLEKHAQRVLADLAPDEQELVEKTLQTIRGRIEGFRTKSDVIGAPVKGDQIVDEFPLQLSFKDADRLRKTFRRYARRTDNGSVQALVGEIADDIDKSMMKAAEGISPEAKGMLEEMRKFTEERHKILDKEVIKEIMSKHGGKRELWAGIAESIQVAAKTGEGPDIIKQLDSSLDYFVKNRRAWMANEYDIKENMIDQVVERWKTDYFDDLRHPEMAAEPVTELTRSIKVKSELGFKGTEVDDVIRRIRKDMTYDEFSKLLFASKDDILNTLRSSTLNDIMGRVEDIGEVAASGGGLWRKMINKMRNVQTDKEARQIVRDLIGFDPIRLNAEIFHGSASQQATYQALFTKPQLNAIKEVTHHLSVITGGGLKYKSNVMVVKLVQAGVLATIAVKTIPLGQEDQSYEWKDATSAGMVLVAPWVLTKVMLKPAWAKWFVKGFTGGVVSREALTNIGRLSVAMWQEDGLPLFIGAGMAEEQAEKVGGAISRGLGAESFVNKAERERK